MVEKRYEPRNIFVLSDNQDILAHDLKFSYVEINDRLAKFVPDKVWQSQRLTLNQKIELNKPSLAMQEQSMLEILDEVSSKIGKQFEAAWLLDGTRVSSPFDLPLECRILLVSTSEEFTGVTGLDRFSTSSSVT